MSIPQFAHYIDGCFGCFKILLVCLRYYEYWGISIGLKIWFHFSYVRVERLVYMADARSNSVSGPLVFTMVNVCVYVCVCVCLTFSTAVWKDWCWRWNSNKSATWCEELTHWKRSWCRERLKEEEKGTTEDEMVGWHHRLNGHEFEQDPWVGNGQGSLACCSPWRRKKSDIIEQPNWTTALWKNFNFFILSPIFCPVIWIVVILTDV